MATPFGSSLKIETPEGFEPAKGESFFQAMVRFLAQCSIGSSVASENSAGNSIPSVENIGDLQTRMGKAENEIIKLKGQEDTVTDQGKRIEALEAVTFVAETVSLDGGTSKSVKLPSAGFWVVTATPVNVALPGLFYTITTDQITFSWDATAGAGAGISYHAKKRE